MAVVLYYHPLSPPSRAVLLTAKALNLSLTLKKVDVLAGEQLKPEFIAINPQHTIPTMVDGNLKLWESIRTGGGQALRTGQVTEALAGSTPPHGLRLHRRQQDDGGGHVPGGHCVNNSGGWCRD
ncbi:Glutathione S-transferase 3-like [Homarus americanus]|uniref:Glutathione S-transferase 3-like n=1 Tax=Homarus americanus TaxID=6706 RepID=A0A8J5JNR9_HOMAM|nr:Glutathione S-transferase 3-like [Homarus americanus]